MAAEVALNYIELRSLQNRLQIAQNNLAIQQQNQQLTQWRVQAGLATSLEAEQARAATAQTAAQIPALQASMAQARHALAILTGQPPAALDAQLLAVKQEILNADLGLIEPQTKKILRSYEPSAIAEGMERLRSL